MGKHIKSLMDAAHAAGYAMAPEDIYLDDDIVERHVMAPSKSTAMVPYQTATPSIGFVAQARAVAWRYTSAMWMLPRLPA